MTTIKLLDARRGLNLKCRELFKDEKIAEAIYRYLCDGIEECEDAQPEQRTGKWIIKTINTFSLAYGSTGYEPVYECSVCGRVTESYLRLDEPIMPEDADFPKFCPECGAQMEGGTDDEG